MPNTKSSTSSRHDPQRLDCIQRFIVAEDYKGLLRELLAVIHRDGGHYTDLVGLDLSVFDAEQKVYAYRAAIRELTQKKKP